MKKTNIIKCFFFRFRMKFDIYQYKKHLLFFSFLGVFLLLFISTMITEQKMNICEINQTKINDLVEVEGYVIRERMISDKTKILTLTKNDCYVDILVQTKRFFEDKEIIVQGKISLYQDKKQIIAEKIYLIE